jgi:hypothetical protein
MLVNLIVVRASVLASLYEYSCVCVCVCVFVCVGVCAWTSAEAATGCEVLLWLG